MAYLDRDGVEIYYEVHGSGPAVLLTHGYSASSRMWRPQIGALSQAGTVIVWDVRGHGRSDSPEDPAAYHERNCTADMAALLDHLCIERAAIGGLSLGGYLSLAFHLDHPERVEALLLFDTGPGFRKDASRKAWNEMARDRGREIAERGAAALDGRTPEQVADEHLDLRGLSMAALHLLAQDGPRVIDSLPGISVPALVLVGADDTAFLAATEYMAAKIPDAEKVVIPNAGHAANLDRPAAFNRAVLGFLGRLDRSGSTTEGATT